jgi:lambda family phage minor tail protein L
MPLDTNSVFIGEKNLQENRPVFLYRVTEYNGTDDLLLAAHDEDVTFDGETYTKFPITHESVSDNSRGEIDSVAVRISNVSRLIQSYLESYDWRGKKVTITQVFLDQLADADAKISFVLYIDNYKASEADVEFQLTTRFDVIDVMLPLGAYNRNYCRWKFKSTECGYVGAESVCNKTKQDCRDNKDNVVRFGGFPSIPQRRLFT